MSWGWGRNMDVKPERHIQGLAWAGLCALSLLLTGVGVLSRGHESLSLFFPVTAVLLGLLIRYPQFAAARYWPAIFIGMLGADLLLGSAWLPSVWYNSCNLLQVLFSVWLLRFQTRPIIGLQQPQVVLALFVATAAGVALGALLSLPVSTPMFANSPSAAWLAWFSEQFATSMLFAPVLVCIPQRWPRVQISWQDLAPFPALFALMLLGLYMGGPGGITFALPALLWCAMRYSMFCLACLVLCVGVAEIVLTSYSLGIRPAFLFTDPLCSTRLGVAMLALSPLLVAASAKANRRLVEKLRYRANHDFLTGALMRGAFTKQTEHLLERRQQRSEALSLLLLDIDHFKHINDRYGHAAGDQALRGFAELIRSQLRSIDLFGRLGGEEFVLLLPQVGRSQAIEIGERLRALVANHTLYVGNNEPLNFTVSIGVASLHEHSNQIPLENLLLEADIALYRAKSSGRNQVVSHSAAELAPV